jgi:hypothetical protein
MKDHLRERMQRDWLFYCQALQMEKSIKPQQDAQGAAAGAAVAADSAAACSSSPSSFSSSPSSVPAASSKPAENGLCSPAAAAAADGDSIMADINGSSSDGVDVTAATHARTLEVWTRTLPLSVEQHAIMQQIISHVQTAAEERESRLKREQEEERERARADSASVTTLCPICLDSPSNALLQPCSHVSCCAGCASDLKKRKLNCPRCNTRIKRVLLLRL